MRQVLFACGAASEAGTLGAETGSHTLCKRGPPKRWCGTRARGHAGFWSSWRAKMPGTSEEAIARARRVRRPAGRMLMWYTMRDLLGVGAAGGGEGEGETLYVREEVGEERQNYCCIPAHTTTTRATASRLLYTPTST
jgi:hypothetical protein